MLPLLARVPVLPCLLTRQVFQDRQQGMFSLLDWISAQVSQSFWCNPLTLTVDKSMKGGKWYLENLLSLKFCLISKFFFCQDNKNSLQDMVKQCIEAVEQVHKYY